MYTIPFSQVLVGRSHRTLKTLGVLIALLITSCAASPSTRGAATPRSLQKVDTSRQQMSVFLGQRSLDEKYWAPLEDQVAIAVDFASEGADSIVGWEAGVGASLDSDEVMGVDIDAATFEVYGGLHKSFGAPAAKVKPYVGAGLAIISAGIEATDGFSTVDDDDAGLGGYAHAGVFLQLSEALFLGLDLRTLFGSDIELFDESGDADYTQIGIVFGVVL